MASLEVNPHIYSHLSFNKGATEFNGKGKLFSVKCAGVTGYSFKKKEKDLNLFSPHEVWPNNTVNV